MLKAMRKFVREISLGVVLGVSLAIAAATYGALHACTAAQVDGGLRVGHELAPISAAVPGGGVAIAAAADLVIGALQKNLEEVKAQQRADHDAIVASGGKPPPEGNLTWKEWLVVLGLSSGAGGGALKLASNGTNQKLLQLATGIAKSFGQAKAGAAVTEIVPTLTDALPIGVDLSHEDVASGVAALTGAVAKKAA